MKLSRLHSGTAIALLVISTVAQNAAPAPGAPSRPKILGVAHIGIRTDNLAAARKFYGGLLGYQEPFSIDKPKSEGGGLLLTYFKVNDHQYIEVFPELSISNHIIHVGVVVSDRAAADQFYREILGFKDIWHGGMTDGKTDWVDMRVPDGTDWLEYMLNVHHPDPKELGVMHHMALGVPSVKAAYETLLKRMPKPSEPPQIGRDGKWQLNLYDPNFTRVELMEPKPVQKPCCSPILQ